MEFRILGPVEAWRDGMLIGISSRRQHAVLATLLLDAGRVVPVERLVRAVWGENAPPTARTQVHACVSALRRRFAPAEVIVTRPAGYLIPITGHELDVVSFEHWVRLGRAAAGTEPARAAERFRQALSLWRGRALGGLDGPVLGPGATVLEERRLLVWEELAVVELELGRHAALVPELYDLVSAEPLRERLVAALMLALYRCDRPADALEVYRRTRRMLVDSQGLEPGPELRRMEQRILTCDPTLAPPGQASLGGAPPSTSSTAPPAAPSMASLAAPRSVPPPRSAQRGLSTLRLPANGRCQLPPAITDFTGRESAIRQLEKILTGASTGLPIVAISGPAGVGKSSLALQLAHRIRRVFPDGQLYADLRGMRTDPAEPLTVLGRLLRAVGLPNAAHGDTVEERASQFRGAVADLRILVVLDDARSAAQVRPLLPGTASCAVIVTSRCRLAGLEGAVHLALETFTPAEAVTLLSRIIGKGRVDAEPAAAKELIRLCGCLPLAVRIAGARLAARPRWRLAQLADRLQGELSRLDELATDDLEVRASLADSYRALPGPVRRLLRLLSLLDAPHVPAWIGAALLDVPPQHAEWMLEQLVDHCLLEVVPTTSGPPRYGMHDLVRLFARERAVTEESATARRGALERAFGAWLAEAERAADRLPATGLATIRADACRWHCWSHSDAPAVDPVAWFDAERAALAASIRQAASLDMAPLSWGLAAAVQPYHELRGLQDEARRSHQTALQACRRTGDLLGEAVLLRNLADLWISRRGADPQDRLATAEAALEIFERLGEARGIADSLWLCADTHRINGRHAQASALLAEALTISRENGYRLGECHAVAQMAIISREQGRTEDLRTLAEQYLLLARELGQGREESVALSLVGLALWGLGQPHQAREPLHQALAVARRIGDRVQETYTLARLGQLYAALGAPQARSTLELALARSRRDGLSFGEALALCGLGELALAKGRPRTAAELLCQAVELLGGLQFAFVRAQALTVLGRARAGEGDVTAASAAWSAAYALFRQIDNDGAAGEVASLLTALEAPAEPAEPAESERPTGPVVR